MTILADTVPYINKNVLGEWVCGWVHDQQPLLPGGDNSGLALLSLQRMYSVQHSNNFLPEAVPPHQDEGRARTFTPPVPQLVEVLARCRASIKTTDKTIAWPPLMKAGTRTRPFAAQLFALAPPRVRRHSSQHCPIAKPWVPKR